MVKSRALEAALSLTGSGPRARARAAHDYGNVYLKLRARLEALLAAPLSPRSAVLDLGCGSTYPNVVLLGADHIGAAGADVETAFYRDGRMAVLRAGLKEQGLVRGILRAGPRYTECGKYFAELERLSGTRFDHASLSLHTYDGQHLPFEDGSMDAVCSNAVLEHVEDLEAFAAEATRVLRPGGVLDMFWHNFYCVSGGHRPASQDAASPWGHITGESPPPCFLNRKKPDEVRAVFEKHLYVRRVIGAGRDHSLADEAGFMPEAAELLDDAWRAKLPGLPDSLLTTRSFLIQAVKPA